MGEKFIALIFAYFQMTIHVQVTGQIPAHKYCHQLHQGQSHVNSLTQWRNSLDDFGIDVCQMHAIYWAPENEANRYE